MPNTLRKKVVTLLFVFLAVEILSFVAFSFPITNQVIFFVLTLTGLLITVRRLEYGLLLVFAELFIGSQGYLFYYQFNDTKISLRLVIWSLVMLIFVIKFVYQLSKEKKKSKYLLRLKKFIFWKPFTYLAGLTIIGLITAFLYGNEMRSIFFDFNGWLYFLLLFPVLAVYNCRDRKPLDTLKLVFWSAAIWLSIKTLILLFIFTHTLNVDPQVYSWLRRTLVGEMTATTTGWPRIFIQSQIFPLIAFLFLFWRSQLRAKAGKFFSSKNWLRLLVGGIFFSSVIISFSRSFWLGAFITLFISLVLVWHYYSFQKMLGSLAWLFTTAVLGVAITYVVAVIPLSQGDKIGRPDFLDRISNQGEAAVVSRWSLLTPLMSEIMKNPILGHGFGSTVTYVSSDPRVLNNNPDGQYTTYAFEWGYLDMWLKTGIFGFLAYLFLLFTLFRASWRKGIEKNNYVLLGMSTGILFLAIIHFFTPYLNHPLGIGFLILSSCLISQDRVY